MKNRKSIVYLGCPGFPYGLAEIQKMLLISKSLVLTGNYVTVICKKGIHKKTDHPELKACGNYENIEYVYTSGNPFREDDFIKRNLLKMKGVVNEFYLLKRRKKNRKLDFAILSTTNFYAVLYYCIISKLFGFKTILNYGEYFSSVKKKWFQLNMWLNDQLFDKYAPLLAGAVFPISEFLINHVKEVSPGKEYLKIPVLTDFDRFNDVKSLQSQKYFLFCGDAGYKEIIKFIVDSFELLTSTSAFLYLVINGDENNIIEIKEYISSSPKTDNIKILSKLTEKQLYTCYRNATALLIPLRPTVQDSARFPHKIGEYLASGNPVISTNYGEVKHYFRDMENMLIANSYEVNFFREKMQFVLDNTIVAKEIGNNGKIMALNHFEYRGYREKIVNFLNELNTNGKAGNEMSIEAT